MEMTTSRERLIEIIDAYGADPGRWPANERDEALKRLQADAAAPDVAAAMERAGELDGWLETIPVSEASPGLRRRVLEASEQPQALDLLARLIQWLFPAGIESHTWIWRPALAAMLPLMVGFLGGVTTATDTATDEWVTWEEEIYLTRIVSLEDEVELLGSQYTTDEDSN